MVGSWKIVNQSLSPNGIGESGGAGTTWTISPKGTLEIDYTGSAPVRTDRGSFTVTGGGVETVQLPTDAAANLRSLERDQSCRSRPSPTDSGRAPTSEE